MYYYRRIPGETGIISMNFVRSCIERDLPKIGLNVSPVMIRNLWTKII